jgi:LuxR family transcriptional regulator, quorum-sensing system regulator CviR
MHARELPEFRSWLSAADAVRLLEITHACVSCATESDFRKLFPRVLELLSFDHGIGISARLGPRGGVVVDQVVNVSYPEEFCREYLSRDYFRVDPVMWNALATCHPQYCCEATHGRPNEIISLCGDFNLREGYVLGARSPGATGGECLFSFKSLVVKQDRRTVGMLEFVGPHLHLAFSRILRLEQAKARQVNLSSREREVLEWLQEGKSSWETSVILGISERTVNFHVYNVTRKLGASNRAQALAVAARLGLLGGQGLREMRSR